jgi:glycine cleavage system aminomethyltransferase T
MSTGKQTPLGVNVMSGLIQGKGFWINNPTASYEGSSTSSTNYTTGSVINNSCLYWLTHSINLSYGNVTSGTQAPSLNKGIGMGYVLREYAALESLIYIEVRDKLVKAKVVKFPFA